ncbi:hypothetical protein ACFX1W_020120 [Malus domestica]
MIARNMLPPSIHPSFRPCTLIPKPRESVAQPKRMRIVRSLKASHTKWKNPFVGGFLYVFEPNALSLFAMSSSGSSPPWTPCSASVLRSVAISSTPPSS